MRDKSKYCPLCGAHQLEWYEGEATEEIILEFKERIKELCEKVEKEDQNDQGENIS